MSAGTTTNIMLDIISGLVVGETFNFFVVSYGSESSTVLPSDHSNITSIVFCEYVIFSIDYFKSLPVTYIGLLSINIITHC